MRLAGGIFRSRLLYKKKDREEDCGRRLFRVLIFSFESWSKEVELVLRYMFLHPIFKVLQEKLPTATKI